MYAGIGGCTASNNLICMHLKEDEGKMNENKELYEGNKKYLY